MLGKSAGAASDEVFAVAASRDDHEGGGGVDSSDAKTLKHATRDIYIPDLHIEGLNKRGTFDSSQLAARLRETLINHLI